MSLFGLNNTSIPLNTEKATTPTTVDSVQKQIEKIHQCSNRLCFFFSFSFALAIMNDANTPNIQYIDTYVFTLINLITKSKIILHTSHTSHHSADSSQKSPTTTTTNVFEVLSFSLFR